MEAEPNNDSVAPFVQDDVPGNIREVSGIEEVKQIAQDAGRRTKAMLDSKDQ